MMPWEMEEVTGVGFDLGMLWLLREDHDRLGSTMIGIIDMMVYNSDQGMSIV